MITTRAELIGILKTHPVPDVLRAYKDIDRGIEKVADAILTARGTYYAAMRKQASSERHAHRSSSTQSSPAPQSRTS